MSTPGRLAQSGASLTMNPGVAGSSPGQALYFRGDLSRNNFYGHSPLPGRGSSIVSVSAWHASGPEFDPQVPTHSFVGTWS